MDIARCTWWNKSYYSHVYLEFVLINRTQRVLNASFGALEDFQNDMMLHVQLYKFMSNEYRFFPVTVHVNTCAEYERNTFDARQLIANYSDMRPCNMKKGVYHVKKGIPVFSRCPPHMPRGEYKAVANFTYRADLLTVLEFYGKIKDKPADWKRLPNGKTN